MKLRGWVLVPAKMKTIGKMMEIPSYPVSKNLMKFIHVKMDKNSLYQCF